MQFMPIMSVGYNWRQDLDAIRAAGTSFAIVQVPMDMLRPHAKQAYRNHGQTLERLADRGGLAPAEALAILDDRPFEPMEPGLASARLVARVIAAMVKDAAAKE